MTRNVNLAAALGWSGAPKRTECQGFREGKYEDARVAGAKEINCVNPKAGFGP